MITGTPGATFDGTMWDGVAADSLAIALGNAPTTSAGWALIPPVRGMQVINAGSDDTTQMYESTGWESDSAEISHYYMESNATATTISVADTAVKAAGNTVTSPITEKFTNTTTNRATYTGSATHDFTVRAVVSMDSGNNKVVNAMIHKNGTVSPGSSSRTTTHGGTGHGDSVTVQTVVELSTNDYIEIYVSNSTDTSDITVTDMNVIVHSV